MSDNMNKFFFRYRLDLMMLPPYLLFNCLLFIFDIDLSDSRWTLSIIRQNCMTKTYPFPEPDWNSNTFPSSVVLTWKSFKYLWHLTRIGKENGVWSWPKFLDIWYQYFTAMWLPQRTNWKVAKNILQVGFLFITIFVVNRWYLNTWAMANKLPW